MAGRGRGDVHGRGGGRPSSSKASSRGGFCAPFVASTYDSHLDARHRNGSTPSQFSLSEEARNTERHHSAWNSEVKLRHSHVAFISAGNSTAEDLNGIMQKSEISDTATESPFQEKSGASVKASKNRSAVYAVAPSTQMSNMTLDGLQLASPPQVKIEEGFDSMPKRRNVEQVLESAEACKEFPFINLKGADETVHTSPVTFTTRRSPSPAGSDSSGEIIIFTGRRQSCKKGRQIHFSDVQSRTSNAKNLSRASKNRSSIATMIDDPINVKAQSVQISSRYSPPSCTPQDPEGPPGHLSCHLRATANKSGRRRYRRHPRKGKKDENSLDDYVANLRDGGDLQALVESSTLNQRDLGVSDTTEWQEDVEPLIMERSERYPLTKSEEWDSADLEDFDELSTSNEALEGIEQVLSKRERPSGIQYLVLGTGCTVDDARWFSVSSLNIHGAKELIRDFEDNRESNHLKDDSDMSDASLTIDEKMVQDLQALDDVEDERDLEERGQARMTDEQVARLLSKQEDLGLGSDDLMLFDGEDVDTNRQEEIQLDGLWERAVTQQALSRTWKTKQPRSNFPSATVLAHVLDQDPYNDFDVMDHQRPSLRKTPKGRRGTLSLELSDSELEQSIHTAWEKDRTKKKMRKQEREELRAQGLLGKKNKTDLKAKYPEGISMTEVKKEIRDFLLSPMESLPLPPMAHGERKVVHEIANVFNLKSKSTGGGKSRYPVLYRTSRTIQFNEKTLNAAESVSSSGRFLPRMDRGKRKGAQAGRSRRGGTATAGVSYRDGEVVGAAAPEIGLGNRGRTMLERMGWSTGTALGALNNSRGLVQPVVQVVKTSRSGLG